MKAFLYDAKHEQVFGEFDLGEIKSDEIERLLNLIDWLAKEGILTRYKSVVLAKSWEREVDTENDDSTIQFH